MRVILSCSVLRGTEQKAERATREISGIIGKMPGEFAHFDAGKRLLFLFVWKQADDFAHDGYLFGLDFAGIP